MPPVTEDHIALVASLQMSFAEASGNHNIPDRLFSLHALGQDTTMTHENLVSAASTFFKRDKDATQAFGLITYGVVAASIVATAMTVSLPAVIMACMGSIAGFAVALAVMDTTTREISNDKMKKYQESAPLLQQLRSLGSKIKTARAAIFETPAAVNAIVASTKFPDALEIASEDEKKILAFAFRASAEKNAEAEAPVVHFPTVDKSPRVVL